MKTGILTFLFLSVALLSFGQSEHYNLKKGVIAKGYDVVAYFYGAPEEGEESISYEYDGAEFHFIDEANLEKFKANPTKYVPQYGGYCAYAIADNGKKVGIDPENYKLVDDKLYLFYNRLGVNTLEKWNKEATDAEWITKGDANWSEIVK